MTLEATLLRTHQQNIDRYCRLLATPLSDVEGDYTHAELEKSAVRSSKSWPNCPVPLF